MSGFIRGAVLGLFSPSGALVGVRGLDGTDYAISAPQANVTGEALTALEGLYNPVTRALVGVITGDNVEYACTFTSAVVPGATLGKLRGLKTPAGVLAGLAGALEYAFSFGAFTRAYPASFTVTSSGAVGGTASKGTATVTITSASGGGGGGGISANLATARVSGVAPLYVNFDATGTTSTATSNPMHELLYVWSFGDSGAGNWVNGVQSSGLISKNTDYGPVSGHVYETPGTYTVNLTVMDGVNTSTQSVTITVQDPNTVYAGSNTICFSQTSSFTGAPSGATLINTAGNTDMLAQWTTYQGSNKRLLWNKAQSWGATGPLNFANLTGMTLGGFGTGTTFAAGNSGTAPSGTAVSVTPTYTSASALFNLNVGNSDIRVCEFKIIATMVVSNYAVVSAAGINYSASQVTWYKVWITQQTQGWNAYPGGGGTDNEFDQHCMYECRTDTTRGDAFIDDASGSSAGGVGVFVGLTRGSILGCYIDNNNAGEHPLRLPYLSVASVAHNYVARPNQAKNVVKIHGFAYNEVPKYTEKFVFSSNVMDLRNGYSYGGTTAAGHTITEVGDPSVIAGNGGVSGNERIRNGLFENNYTYGCRGQPKGQQGYVIGGPGCTIRNNIVDFYLGSSGNVVFNCTYGYPTATLATVQASTPDPTVSCWIYNNTIYTNMSVSTSPLVWMIGSTTAGVVIKNNIGYMPFIGTYWSGVRYYAPDGSTYTASNNTPDNTVNPNFTSLPPVALTDWKPATGSYAINSGATVPVLQDFFRAARSGTYSMGAVLS